MKIVQSYWSKPFTTNYRNTEDIFDNPLGVII